MKMAWILALISFTSAYAEPPQLTLKSEKEQLPAGVAEALKTGLSAEALTVRDHAGPVMRFWLMRELAGRATAEQVKNGLTYREIPEGTFLGVVQFEKAFVDFRKQEIPAGTYGLRMAVQPDIGDHKDTAPHQDFLLLVPIGVEKSAEMQEIKNLVPRSSKITGGDHPAVVLLFPHFGKETEAKLIKKPDAVICLQTRIPVVAAEQKTSLGFAIVVNGFSSSR